MVKNCSCCLCKKMYIDEFQELGFFVQWIFLEGIGVDVIDEIVDVFIDEVIEVNGLVFDGSGYLQWEGLICL